MVLESDRVITGRISIEPLHHLILFENNEARTVYPAHAIKSLYFYDEANNINRRFVSVREKEIAYRQYHLYEIVLQGEITFLRRQNSKTNHPSDALDFNYYVRYGGDMVSLRKFRRKIYPDLRMRAGASLEDFIAANNIRTTSDKNLIRIVEFYNRLVKSDETIAKY
ncbi:MAG: hypothetical protein C0490_02390 [Marivirga sp.]|nr:hypothetical protein [Marivirga sp.]